MRAILLFVVVGCGGKKSEPQSNVDCDAVIAESPCLGALFARVDAITTGAGDAANAFEATASAGASACESLRASGVASVDIRLSSPACGEAFATRVECATALDPSFDPATVDLSCSSDTIAGTCAADCTGSCVRFAPDDCAGTCYDVCGGTCDGASSRGVCLGTCTGPCAGTCVADSAGACDSQCLGACSEEMQEAGCVAGAWSSPDACVAACDSITVSCVGQAASFADAPGADTDPDLAAQLDGLEGTLSAYAFTAALADAWGAILTEEVARLSGDLESTAGAETPLTHDEATCLGDELPTLADDLTAAAADYAQRVEAARASWSTACGS